MVTDLNILCEFSCSQRVLSCQHLSHSFSFGNSGNGGIEYSVVVEVMTTQVRR